MNIANRDLFPSDATRARFADIEPLLENALLDAAFLRHEAKAVRAKRIYHRVGRFAILLIAISAIYTIADALVMEATRWTTTMTLIAAVIATVGIGLQAAIILTRQKQVWLLNRFACERIRSLKFQSFHLGDNAPDKMGLKAAVDAFTTRHLSRLDNDLNAGMTVLERFSPDKALDTPDHEKLDRADPAMAVQAREAFEELRVRYQINFASSEVSHLRDKMRSVTSLQDVMYFSAVALAFVSLGIKIFDPAHVLPTNWIDFAAITLFISGATKAITDNALLQEQSQGRYQTYIGALEHAMVMAQSRGASLDETVDAIERICLVELDLFCQDALRVSYRF